MVCGGCGWLVYKYTKFFERKKQKMRCLGFFCFVDPVRLAVCYGANIPNPLETKKQKMRKLHFFFSYDICMFVGHGSHEATRGLGGRAPLGLRGWAWPLARRRPWPRGLAAIDASTLETKMEHQVFPIWKPQKNLDLIRFGSREGFQDFYALESLVESRVDLS